MDPDMPLGLPGADKSAPTLQRFHSPEADKSAMGTMMDFNKLIWTCHWVCRGPKD